MSRTITKRELNQQTSQVLAAVQSDGATVITERGVPLWRIEAVGGPSTPLERLATAGRVIAAKKDPAPWGPIDEARAAKGPNEIDALLDELRKDSAL